MLRTGAPRATGLPDGCRPAHRNGRRRPNRAPVAAIGRARRSPVRRSAWWCRACGATPPRSAVSCAEAAEKFAPPPAVQMGVDEPGHHDAESVARRRPVALPPRRRAPCCPPTSIQPGPQQFRARQQGVGGEQHSDALPIGFGAVRFRGSSRPAAAAGPRHRRAAPSHGDGAAAPIPATSRSPHLRRGGARPRPSAGRWPPAPRGGHPRMVASPWSAVGGHRVDIVAEEAGVVQIRVCAVRVLMRVREVGRRAGLVGSQMCPSVPIPRICGSMPPATRIACS